MRYSGTAVSFLSCFVLTYGVSLFSIPLTFLFLNRSFFSFDDFCLFHFIPLFCPTPSHFFVPFHPTHFFCFRSFFSVDDAVRLFVCFVSPSGSKRLRSSTAASACSPSSASGVRKRERRETINKQSKTHTHTEREKTDKKYKQSKKKGKQANHRIVYCT